MIIDCFPYFNEKELLELRIKLLYDKVDKFVITEGDHTHKGDPKPFTFLDTIKQLNIPMEKIIYIQVNLPSKSENPNAWVRERMQRNAASKFIQEGDVAFVGDLDEIINPDFIEYYVSVAKLYPNNILRVPLVFLCSKANLRVHNQNGECTSWSSPFMVMKQQIEKYTLSEIRESHALGTDNISYSDIYITDDNKTQEAGWHFTWMGNEARRQQKLNAFLHWDEVNLTDNYTPRNGSLDPLGREDHILLNYSEKNLPPLINELKNVKEFLFGATENNLSLKNMLFTKNKMNEKTLVSVLKENPFITTDKNSVCYYQYRDKWMFLQYHSYIEGFYEEHFAKYRDKENTILEIGIDTGGSIALWHEYFSNSTILGIDIKKERVAIEYDEDKLDRAVYAYVKDAYDPIFANTLGSFDIIIDDGPHTYESQEKAIDLYLPKLKLNGLLVIEDISSIEYAHSLYNKVPNNGSYETAIIDLREKDDRYDSIMLSVKRVL